MITSFEIYPHNFHIFNKDVNDYTIRVYRQLRSDPLPGMIQPVPKGCTIGYETIVEVLKNHRVCNNILLKLFKDMRIICSAVTDAFGKCRIDLPMSLCCKCTPFDLCDDNLPTFILEISDEYSSEPQKSPRKTRKGKNITA